MKSQRGGPGEIPVKKVVGWPPNFILTRNRKSRPTYDDLTITQWVSGCKMYTGREVMENQGFHVGLPGKSYGRCL